MIIPLEQYWKGFNEQVVVLSDENYFRCTDSRSPRESRPQVTVDTVRPPPKT